MMAKKIQAGCLPIRRSNKGDEVLLITSRYRGDWILPKGSIEEGEKARRAAVREAAEEAGVRGQVLDCLGLFMQPRGETSWPLEVFVLEVDEVLDSWPEQNERRRAWYSVHDALVAASRHEMREALTALEIWLRAHD
jgi:8-oxo-dGTP pyrophosphatase MutT (NUDIX family)